MHEKIASDAKVGIDGENVVLVDLAANSKQVIENSTDWIWNIKLGSTQLAYNITDDSRSMGDIYGFDLTTQTKYTVRNQGSTFLEFNLNKSTEQLIMCSVGSGNDPNEWDVSIVQLS